MRARTRPPCPERRKRKRKAASKTMSKTAVEMTKQGGPIPVRNKQASYYLTPGRNPILQIDPHYLTGGSIPRANVLGPSVLESNTEALQTFLGQRQSAAMGGGQLPRQMMKRVVGTQTSATGNLIAGTNPITMQFASYEQGASNNIRNTQNAINQSAPSKIMGIDFLRYTTPARKSGSQLTNNAVYENVNLQPVNLSGQLNVEDASGDTIESSEEPIFGDITNDNIIGVQATAPAMETRLISGRLVRTPIAGRTRSRIINK